MIVDNRASASGVVAAEIVANSPPDGYTLFVPYHQHTVNAALNPKLPYHAVNSFTPITQLTAAGLMLVVNPSSPPKTLKEFVEWTKNYKGPLNFGSAGLGSGGHLAGELYNVTVGIKAQHIPYKGSGPALIDLVAGQYQYNFAGIQAAQTLVRGGKLRGLAVTNPKRIAAIPDLPAVAEVLPGFEIVGWYGIAAPAKLPKPILMRLHAEIVKIIQDPGHSRTHPRRRLRAGREFAGGVPQVHAGRSRQVGQAGQGKRRQARLSGRAVSSIPCAAACWRCVLCRSRRPAARPRHAGRIASPMRQSGSNASSWSKAGSRIQRKTRPAKRGTQ